VRYEALYKYTFTFTFTLHALRETLRCLRFVRYIPCMRCVRKLETTLHILRKSHCKWYILRTFHFTREKLTPPQKKNSNRTHPWTFAPQHFHHLTSPAHSPVKLNYPENYSEKNPDITVSPDIPHKHFPREKLPAPLRDNSADAAELLITVHELVVIFNRASIVTVVVFTGGVSEINRYKTNKPTRTRPYRRYRATQSRSARPPRRRRRTREPGSDK